VAKFWRVTEVQATLICYAFTAAFCVLALVIV
jgi:hypothetical protein